MVKIEEEKEERPRKLDAAAKEVLRDNLFEPEIPTPHWIKEQADGKQQEKEWKQRESAKPQKELNDPTISHPMQAYSYKMGEVHPLEGMMWGLLERIGFIPVYHAHTVKELSFELGKVYEKYMTKLQEYVENKGK